MAANNPFLAASGSGAAANNPFAAFAAKKEAQVSDDPFAPKKTGEKCEFGHIHFPSTKKIARWWAKAQAGWLLCCASACFCSLSPPMLSLRTLVYRVNQLQRGSRTRSWQAFHQRPQAVRRRHLLTVQSECVHGMHVPSQPSLCVSHALAWSPPLGMRSSRCRIPEPSGH
jgi:hypothetical protein